MYIYIYIYVHICSYHTFTTNLLAWFSTLSIKPWFILLIKWNYLSRYSSILLFCFVSFLSNMILDSLPMDSLIMINTPIIWITIMNKRSKITWCIRSIEYIETILLLFSHWYSCWCWCCHRQATTIENLHRRKKSCTTSCNISICAVLGDPALARH